MLESFKRFFSNQGLASDLSPISDWATRRGHSFRRARDDEGFVIEGALEGKPWRMEWGPSQRDYIEGQELRVRIELVLPADMQMLLLTKPLMALLERRTYEQFVEGTQTQIGSATPEEMRWLVMFPKVNLAGLKSVRAHFGAVASQPLAGQAWIEGPLANALERACDGLLRDAPPFVLMTLRGRAYLRMQLGAPDPTAVSAALVLFETAVTQAVSASGTHGDATGDWSTTAASAWQSLRPDDPADRKRR